MAKKLQVKIMLKDSKPPIWRRIWIEDDITFLEFHNIIQDAMGWYSAHLYEFQIGRLHIGVPYEESYTEITDSLEILVHEILKKKGDKILYTYDFGDDWRHDIIVEKAEPLVSTDIVPICIKGKGNCPPEDCGGVWGYQHLREIVKDKKHPEYEEMLEWLGGDLYLEPFDIEDVNLRLESYQ